MSRSAVIILTGPARAARIFDDAGRSERDISGLQAIPRCNTATMYVVNGEHAEIRYDVVATDKPAQYCWGLRTPGCAALVTASATSAPDQLSAEHLGSCRRAVSLALPPDAAAKTFSMQLIGLPTAGHPLCRVTRRFELSGLPIGPGQRLSARLDDGGQELQLTNHGPTTTAALRTRACSDPPSAICSVTIEAGVTTVLRPSSWTAPGPICFEVRDTPTGPAHRWGQLTA